MYLNEDSLTLESMLFIHYLRLKYSVSLPKSVQANVVLLTLPDEIHDITEYELNNDRVHNGFFQVVIYDLK